LRLRHGGHNVSTATRGAGEAKFAKRWQMAICGLACRVHFAQALRHDAVG
jgi:hypothetical protein